MTPPSPPDRQLARDVAKQLDRRRLRRRMTLWSALLALVAAAAAYLRCGSGLGLGGGAGSGEGGDRQALTAPQRCAIRLTASGLTADGKVMARDAAVTACQAAPGVDVYVTGDARHGDREDLLAALRAAGVKDIALHEPTPGGPSVGSAAGSAAGSALGSATGSAVDSSSGSSGSALRP
jgi:hypothetical protein